MIKKVLTVILVLTVVVPLAVWGMSGARVSAATGYSLIGNTLTITGTGDMEDYREAKNTPWYNDRSKIREVVISNGVTSIGKNAFAGTTVMDVTISNTVTKIGESAFSGCKSLTGIVMPNSITQIGKDAFNTCTSMTSVTLSNKLEAIPDKAFYSCSALKKITIPSSVKSIGYQAFLRCGNLDVTFSEGLETIGDWAFGGAATYEVGIINEVLTIPDSVTSIGEYAFSSNSHIVKVVTGANLKTIGTSAFNTDKNLYTVDLSRSAKLNSIGTRAFYGTVIASITIPDSVTTVGTEVFYECRKLTTAKLSKNQTSISDRMFSQTALSSIEIPSSVTSIGKYAFENTKLTKVVVPSSVTDLGQFAFTNCGDMTAADISLNRTMVLGIAVFSGCKMDHIHIPEGRDPSYYMSNGIGWPAEYCFFGIGSDGKCPAAICPFREGAGAVGDVNGDGKLNNADIILLGRAYMAGDTAKYLAVADMNNDGRITNADIILLGRLYMTGK